MSKGFWGSSAPTIPAIDVVDNGVIARCPVLYEQPVFAVEKGGLPSVELLLIFDRFLLSPKSKDAP